MSLKDFCVFFVGMGIPSYFRHLLQRYPHILSDVTDKTKSNILLVDFNCLIYLCAKSRKLPIYTHEGREVWEAALLNEIRSYVHYIWTLSGKPEKVVLAVDGVVPMAKIRQQRLRRFKGAWLTGKEYELGAKPKSEEVWDTNCITPGTAFMDRLEFTLKDMGGPRNWVVSSANEPGEGEQKLMEWVRAQPAAALAGKHIIVYGLDADLILLCLLHARPETTWSVMREKQEFLKSPLVYHNERPPHLLMSIQKMQDVMFPDTATRDRDIRDYIAGMSLLGNDFIPHNIGIHLRDFGHDRLLNALSDLHEGGSSLLSKDENGLWKWDATSLLRIIGAWVQTEESDIEHSFVKKYKMPLPPPKGYAEQCLLPIQNMAIDLAEEARMWSRRTGQLLPEWKGGYYREKRGRCLTSPEIGERCAEYLRGLQWNIDYYTGQRPVSSSWMYAWTYSPLWSDIREYLERTREMPLAPEVAALGLKPQEQLALVLPSNSWWLIRDPELRAIPAKIPHFWPDDLTFSSLGKRWLWECNPEIPILTPARLRVVLHQRAVA